MGPDEPESSSEGSVSDIAALDDNEFARLGREDAKELKAKAGTGRVSIALDQYAAVFHAAGTERRSRALRPMQFEGTWGHPTEREQRKAAAAADAAVFEVVAQECAVRRRADAVQALVTDAQRRSGTTIWNQYLHGVTSIAFLRGDKEAIFVRKFADLVAGLADADDDDDLAAVIRQLNRLTAPVKYPVLPAAAWEAADLYPVADDRQAEYDRLTELYGPRDGAPINDATTKPTRTLRKPRALTAVR